jgi:hypothetical protein
MNVDWGDIVPSVHISEPDIEEQIFSPTPKLRPIPIELLRRRLNIPLSKDRKVQVAIGLWFSFAAFFIVVFEYFMEDILARTLQNTDEVIDKISSPGSTDSYFVYTTWESVICLACIAVVTYGVFRALKLWYKLIVIDLYDNTKDLIPHT